MEKELFNSKNWNVAVFDLQYEFEDEGQISITKYKSAGADGGRVVSGMLAANFANLDNISVIEPERLNKPLEEQALQQSGIIDVSTAVNAAKMVGADAVVIGELTDYVYWENVAGYGSTVSFSIRMVDVQTNKVILNSSISRVRHNTEPFANVQLTTEELVNTIKNKK